MSRQSRIDGVEGAIAFLDRDVPNAAREQLSVEMAIIGREVLAAQRADVAKDTGATEAALTLQLLVEQLKVRIGLIKGSSSRGSRNGFVGRLIEFGRKAQTVVVTRRLKRRVRGNGRYGTKRRVIYEGKPYTLRVRAMAPRPFIAQPELRDAAEQHLSEYWQKVLTRAGGRA